MYRCLSHRFRIKLLLLALSSLIISGIHSQSEFLKLANENYKRQDFYEASKNYKSAWIKIEKDKELLTQAGISSYHANDLEFAIRCFEKIIDQWDPYDQATNLILAKCYHHKNDFEKAIVAYKRYLRTIGKNDAQRLFVKNELLRCEKGLKYKKRSPVAIVESVGAGINTVEDEFAPVPDPGKNGQYFISAIRQDNSGGKRNVEGMTDFKQGRFHSDVFIMKQLNGFWNLSRHPDSNLNSNMDDQILGCFNDGSVLMIYRSWNDQNGNLILDTLNNENSESGHFSINPVRSEIGDHAVSVFQDSLMIFSSCRSGGYGGYDLYLSVFKNGEWSRAVNLGAKINSAFNEDYPFLANDGLTLYFSSDNLYSIGAYDIFKSKYQPEAQLWTTPQNLGIPVNSTGDDIYFHLTNEGLAGIFSSNRKMDNRGGHDLYFAYFKEDLTEQLEVSKGSPLMSLMETESMTSESNPVEMDESLTLNLKKAEQKNYFIEPVYYYDEDYLHNPRTTKILDRLLAMLQLNPDLSIQFIGHSYEESQNPVNLYFSIKKAEELEMYLVDHKISKTRIRCIGLGASLPVAKQVINGNKSTVADKLNKRIEVYIVRPDTSAVKINYAPVPIANAMKSDKPGPFYTLRTGLKYSLYLGESSSILNHPLIQASEDLVYVEKSASDNKYDYYYGVYTSFKDAERDLKKYQTQFNTNLEIKAFDDGMEMTRAEIIDHVLQDADLLLFLNYLNLQDKNHK